jgi:hypothetical protein
MKNKKLEVGQTVYWKQYDRYSKTTEIRECKITKVGNKYFYLNRDKFDIEDMTSVLDFGTNYRVYTSIQEIENEDKLKELITEIRNIVGQYGGLKISLDLFSASKDLLKELMHLVNLLEPLEQAGTLDIPGLATLNGARKAIDKAL